MGIAVPETESDWQARDDARTLCTAEAIKRDPDRMRKAVKAAGGLAGDEQRRAKEAKVSARVMTRLAGRGKKEARR